MRPYHQAFSHFHKIMIKTDKTPIKTDSQFVIFIFHIYEDRDSLIEDLLELQIKLKRKLVQK